MNPLANRSSSRIIKTTLHIASGRLDSDKQFCSQLPSWINTLLSCGLEFRVEACSWNSKEKHRFCGVESRELSLTQVPLGSLTILRCSNIRTAHEATESYGSIDVSDVNFSQMGYLSLNVEFFSCLQCPNALSDREINIPS